MSPDYGRCRGIDCGYGGIQAIDIINWCSGVSSGIVTPLTINEFRTTIKAAHAATAAKWRDRILAADRATGRAGSLTGASDMNTNRNDYPVMHVHLSASAAPAHLSATSAAPART